MEEKEKYEGPYTKLAVGIIIQAIEDYQSAVRFLRSDKPNKKAQDEIKAKETLKEIEQFVDSKWFSILCDLDKEKVKGKLKEIKEGGR